MTKAIRKLSNFDFSKATAHVALVHKDQGGPANGVETLLFKAVAKAPVDDGDGDDDSEVRVTLSMEDFLCYFFNMWKSDAQALCTILGYSVSDNESNDYYQENIAE